MTDLTITIDGCPLQLACTYGDIEQKTVWPGGSDELSWSVGSDFPASLSHGALPVTGRLGPDTVWGGYLLEPDPSQDKMIAQGLWYLGDSYAALTAGGLANDVPDTAVDQAIIRGLPWTRPNSLRTTSASIDISQGPVTVKELLDTWAANNAVRWGVTPDGVVYSAADPTTPAYQTFPLDGSLGYALDDYASTLVGRYQTSTGYATSIRTDTVAEARHGHRETVVDITDRGPLGSGTADNILDRALILGRSKPQWTENIVFKYGEIVTTGFTPVALESVAAGQMLRVHGGPDLARSTLGNMYVDLVIGATTLSGGELTVQPLQHAARTFADFAERALRKKKDA